MIAADSAVARAASMLREHLAEIGFVRLHRHLQSAGLCGPGPGQRPHLLRDALAATVWSPDSDGQELALTLCLMADVPAVAARLPPGQAALAEALLQAGLLRRAGPVLRMAGLQLTSFFGVPLFIDRRLAEGTAAHEVYLGPDTALLAYYIDTARLGPSDRALELGTGTGALSLYLSRFAGAVTATDIAPAALRLASLNCLLSGRADAVKLRCEDFLTTLERGERYRLLVCNPPYLAVPEGLRGPVFAAGPGRDGLDHCRMLLELFDHVVEPAGTAYLVAALPGDARRPCFLAELAGYAGALDLCIDVFIDGQLDLELDPDPLARHAQHLLRCNPHLEGSEVLARVRALYLEELGARRLYLCTLVARRIASAPPAVTVFRRPEGNRSAVAAAGGSVL